MIAILNDRRSPGCFGDGEMIGLTPGFREFLISPDGWQSEPRNTSDVDCQVWCLTPPAAVSPPASF
jgi:hypothetical protein